METKIKAIIPVSGCVTELTRRMDYIYRGSIGAVGQGELGPINPQKSNQRATEQKSEVGETYEKKNPGARLEH